MTNDQLRAFIDNALREDVGSGDYTSLAIIPPNLCGKATLYVKEEGIIAGVDIAEQIFNYVDNTSSFEKFISDGTYCAGKKEVAFMVEANVQALLKTERLILNIMQRMSGIATVTHKYVEAVKGTSAKILDTRKTTPGFRYFEKEAVRMGGGTNHRFGLFDMIMIKDNHIDFAGSIEKAIHKTILFLKDHHLNIPLMVEARSLKDVETILTFKEVKRILLDNFSVDETRKAVEWVNHRIELESSGGITLTNVRDYALCGVDFISIGALTHHVKSLDLSLKAKF